MPKKFEDVLDLCLDRLAGGEDIVQVLRDYPDHADELRPLLEVASGVRAATSPVQPRPEFRAQARQRLMVQARAKREEARKPGWFAFVEWQKRWAFAAAAVVMVILLGGGATVAASTDAMPDDVLYPVKIAVERVRVSFTGSDVDKARMEAKFAERRVKEIAAMMEQEKWSKVESTTQRLANHLEAIGDVAAKKRIERTISAQDADKLANTLAFYATDLPLVLEKAIVQSPVESGAAIGQLLDDSENRVIRAVEDLNMAVTTASGGDSGSAGVVAEPVSGIVRVVRGEKWMVGSKVVNVTATTAAGASPDVGSAVDVEVTVQPDGSLIAQSVKPQAVRIVGPEGSTAAQPVRPPESQPVETPLTVVIATPVRQIDESATRSFEGTIRRVTENALTIGNYTLIIEKGTIIQGELQAGAKAAVQVSQQNDGSLLAHSIKVQAPAISVPSTGVVEKPPVTVDVVEQPTVRPVPTSTPKPTTKPAVVPSPTPTAPAVITPTVKPAVTPSVAVTPKPVTRELTGTIERMTESAWVVDGQVVNISNDTEVKGMPAIGSLATVIVEVRADGSLEARSAVIEASDVNQTEATDEAPALTSAPDAGTSIGGSASTGGNTGADSTSSIGGH